MIYIAQYVWPFADDFEMGLGTKAAFQETGSLWEVLKEAAQFAKYKYGNWQGTFSAIFLMALQPGIWGDEYYGIVGKQNKWQPVYICMAGVFFLLAIKQTGIEDTNLYMLLKDLKAGVFQKADSFQQERKEYFEAHQGEDIVVERLPYRSEITFFVDLVYKGHVFNTTMAEYYGVKSISVSGE